MHSTCNSEASENNFLHNDFRQTQITFSTWWPNLRPLIYNFALVSLSHAPDMVSTKTIFEIFLVFQSGPTKHNLHSSLINNNVFATATTNRNKQTISIVNSKLLKLHLHFRNLIYILYIFHHHVFPKCYMTNTSSTSILLPLRFTHILILFHNYLYSMVLLIYLIHISLPTTQTGQLNSMFFLNCIIP